MPKLAFHIEADYQKVVRLREEIDKLKSTISGMDGNTSPATFRAMEVQLAKNTKELDSLVVSAVRAGNEISQGFKKKIFDASQIVSLFSDKIIDQRAVIRDIEADVKNLSSTYSKLNKFDPNRGKMLAELNASRSALTEEKAILFGLQQEQSKARLSVKRLRDEYALYNNEGRNVSVTNQGMSVSFGKVLGVIGGVGVLKELASEITTVTGQFQRFENVLTNALGGDNNKAKQYLGDIADFAAKTNFQLDELTENFLKFVNRGVTPSMESMTKLGDFTNSVSKPYAQLSEAILDINNPERWKEFGVQVQTNGSKVNLTFRGMKIEADRTVESVMNAIEQFGSMDGIKGSTEAIAGTIEGQMSNLQDTITSVLNEIGQANSEVISGGISMTSELIQNYDKVGRVIVGLIATYGTYRTAVMLAATAENGHSIAMLLTRERIVLVRRAQQFLNATMLANPYVAVTTLVVGLVAAMWALSESTTAAEKAQKKFSERMQNIEDDNKKRKEQVDKLISVIQDETAAEIDRYKAIQELRKLVPEATKNMSDEAIMTGELTEQKKKYNEELSKQIGLEKQRELNQLYAKKKNLENSIKTDKGTKGYKYQYRADQDQLILNEIDKQIAKLEKEKADFFKLKERSNQETKISSISDEIKATTEKISTLKQAIADLRSGKATAEAGKTVQSAIEDKMKELKATEDALATLTGKDKSSDKKFEDEQKKLLEKQKTIYSQLFDLRLQNQQSEIDLMQEGSEKKIAQINLDYDNEIAAILAKEKEWKDAQGGKLTKEQTVEIRMAKVNAGAKLGSATTSVINEQLEAESQAMNEYLKEYGSYMEKRQAITELYNDRIAKATTEGERLSLGEEMKKALATVDDEAQKKTSIVTKLFSDMSKRTVTDIRAIAKEAQEMLDYVNSGEFKTDSDGNGLFGLTEDQFDILSKSPEKLQAIKDEIVNVDQEADQMDTSFNKISGGLKKVFSAGDDAKKLKEGLAEIEAGVNDVMQAGQFLSDTFSKLGDAFGSDLMSGIADGLNVAMDAMDSAMQGAKAGAMFGPIGASAGAAIGVVTSLAGAIAKIHDAKNEKRIERLQDQIDTLDKSYEKLDKSIQKAYSNDASNLIEQQNKLLEQQKVLIQQQIREEQDKKKTDKDRIKEWQDQIDAIDEAIADNKEKAVDAIFGEDLKSAIDNFANAYAEAWASGEDKAESAKDTVKKMMRQMVTESIKAAMESSGAMEKIRQKLKEFYADNVLSGWEQDYIYNMAEELQRELDRQFGWADSLMKDETEEDVDDTSDNSLKGAYAKASQESINLLAGQTGAVHVLLEDIRGSMQPIREQMRLIYDMQSRGWEDVKAIRELSDKVEKNTEQIADNTKEIKSVADKIDQNTRNTVDALEGTINVKVKM